MKAANWQRSTVVAAVSSLLIAAASGLLAQTVTAQFSSPPGQGTPKGTAGGGSRPMDQACLKQSHRQGLLVAMAPTKFIGLTPHASPTVWVYLPDTVAKTLEFSLFTHKQEGIYQVNLPIRTPGLVKIRLPSEAKLIPAKPYSWTVALVCNPEDRTRDWLVTGQIQYQPLNADLQRQLAGATAEQQVKLYAQSQFWYEAFDTYLKLQPRSGSANWVTLWSDLLKTAELPEIAKTSSMTQFRR